MNPNRIFTKKTMGLDNRVWRLLFAMILLPLGLLSYRLMDEKKCTSFSITVKTLGVHSNEVFYTGETLSFIASTSSKDISWDFGDNTSDVGASVHHEFLKEGIFLVTAKSNTLCQTEKLITIKKRPVVVQQSENTAASIAGPSSCYTFTEQIFTFPGTAQSYEWSVPNHQSLGIKTGQTITYTFPYAGIYTVQVELDHDRRKRYRLDVTVDNEIKPKSPLPEKISPLIIPNNPPPKEIIPPEPTPVPRPAAPDTTAAEAPVNKILIISDVTFLAYLEKVMNKEMAVQDFEKYGISANTPVVVNDNKKEKKTFGELCEDISSKKKKLILFKKKIRLESAQLHRINKLVTVVDVHYK